MTVISDSSSVGPNGTKATICICSVQVPFVVGGATHHISALREQLTQRNYAVDVVALPAGGYGPQIVRDCLAWRMLNIQHSFFSDVDLVIATNFPSYLVRHPRKITWLFHQFRSAYDCYMTTHGLLNRNGRAEELRDLIFGVDELALRESQHVFANSERVAERLWHYNGIESTALYHPPKLVGKYRDGPYGNYILSVGRLEGNKRVDLLLEALAETHSDIECRIVGMGTQYQELQKQVARLGLGDRVVFMGQVSDEELIEAYSEAFAVYFAPYDEDFGYVTLEAFHSKKPVIASEDSGAVLEFVEDGRTGLVTEPIPEEIGQAIERLFEDRDLCRQLGQQGYERIQDITWDGAIAELVACLDA